MKLDIVNSLNRRVQSVFRPETVFLHAYDTFEARDSGRPRASRFYDGVIPSNVLDQVAGMTSDTDDLRVGIDLLQRAELETEADARTTITNRRRRVGLREIHVGTSVAPTERTVPA
jgi:cell division control protein 6